MISRTIILVVGALLVALINQQVIAFFPYPWNLLALNFLLGIIILHFIGASFGWLWLVISGLFLDFLGSSDRPETIFMLITATLGVFLFRRFFTDQSIYAMAGLALTMQFIFSFLSSIWYFLQGNFNDYLHSLLREWQVFILAVIFFFFVCRRLVKFLRTILLIRSI